MECRKLTITLVSAKNLPDVRHIGSMKVFAKVSINGESKTTPIDLEGETNPSWGFSCDFTIVESEVEKHGTNVNIKLCCERTLRTAKFIGEVNIPIPSLLDRGRPTKGERTFPVTRTNDSRATLNIKYSVGECIPAGKPSVSDDDDICACSKYVRAAGDFISSTRDKYR